MNNLTKKLNGLESNIVSSNISEDTCFISLESVPQAEKELHYKAQQIAEDFGTELNEQQRALIEKSAMLLSLRALLLCRKMLKAFCMIPGDSVYSSMFDTRLMWFVAETIKFGKQAQDMVQLEKENANLDVDSLEQKRIENRR